MAQIRIDEGHEFRRVVHDLRRRHVTVRRIERVAAWMLRVTFAGDDLADFASASFDDHVKMFFPDANGNILARDYTPRRFDAMTRELDIEFTLHGDGPATRWSETLKPGDVAEIGGPRSSHVIPTDFDWYVLIADETGMPALARRLEELTQNVPVFVIGMVDSEDDCVPLAVGGRTHVTWIYRAKGDIMAHLIDAISRLQPPIGDGHAWAACESSTARVLRDVLSTRLRLRKAWVKTAGYWRRGEASTHEVYAATSPEP